MWIVAVWDDENWSKWAKHGWNQPKNEHQVKRRWRERIIRFWARNLWFFLLQQTTNALGITHNGEHNYSEVEDNQKLRSVPRLGLRFFSLRTTSLIYGYSLTRKIYWCLNMIWRGLYMCVRDDHQDIVIESYADTCISCWITGDKSTFVSVSAHLTWMLRYNVLGTSWKWLAEYVRTYQDPPCWSPKPTPCPSPVSPSQTLKVCTSRSLM